MTYPMGPEGLGDIQVVQDPSERPTELRDVEGLVRDGGGEHMGTHVPLFLFLVEVFGQSTLPQFF